MHAFNQRFEYARPWASEGLDAVSIRRIANELGSGAMSLYRHVSSKDQILDLLLDAAYGEIAVPPAVSGDWRNDLRNMARQTRRILKRHWWLGPLLTSRPPFGSHYLRWFEFLLAAAGCAGAALDMQSKVRMVGTLFAFVNGAVGYELGEESTNRKHNLTPERKREIAAPILAPLLATGRYPNLAQFAAQGTGEMSDEDFDFRLECVLAGLGVRVAQDGRA
ncbi:MAG: TetR/AcrR family transcriptional regulator [Candidatus Solibacter sp.]